MVCTCLETFATLALVMMLISWAGTTTQNWTLNSTNTTEIVDPGTTTVTVANDSGSDGCIIVSWTESNGHPSHDYTVPAGSSLHLVPESGIQEPPVTISKLTIRRCPGVANASGSTTW